MGNRFGTSVTLALCSMLATVTDGAAALAGSYSTTDLGTLGGSSGVGKSINNSGSVTWSAYTAGDSSCRAFRGTSQEA